MQNIKKIKYHLTLKSVEWYNKNKIEVGGNMKMKKLKMFWKEWGITKEEMETGLATLFVLSIPFLIRFIVLFIMGI